MAEIGPGGIDRAGVAPSSWIQARTLTFLLTDVEGSSRLWQDDPSAASVALERRQRIISDSTSCHGGMLPLEQGEGDSSVSVFARGVGRGGLRSRHPAVARGRVVARWCGAARADRAPHR